MKTFKQSLNEWPYSIKGEKVFDFEVEKYHTLSEFETLLKYLTSGIDIKDKYGNVFKTSTKEGKEKFKKRMLSDPDFISSATSQFNISKKNIINKVKNL